MKAKDMQALVGTDAEVAVLTAGTAEWARDYGRRAVIIAIRQTRRVHSGARWDFSGHNAQDGVLVRWTEDAADGNSKAGEDEVVGPRQIADLWEPYAEARDRRRGRVVDREQRLADERSRAEAAAAAIEGATAYPIFSGGVGDHRLTGYRVLLSLDAAERLARVAS